MWPISGRANADSETGLQRFDDVSVSSKGAQVPGKLLSSILDYLRPEREDGPFDPLLARCSLTCRHWAAHIRPHTTAAQAPEISQPILWASNFSPQNAL